MGSGGASTSAGRRTGGGSGPTPGHADQAHLVRELQQFTGTTPTGLLATLPPARGPSHRDGGRNDAGTLGRYGALQRIDLVREAMGVVGLKQSAVIDRPPAEVFAFVSDLERPAVDRSGGDAPDLAGPLGVGTTFRWRDWTLERPLRLSTEVVGCRPNHRIAVRASSRLLGGPALAVRVGVG